MISMLINWILTLFKKEPENVFEKPKSIIIDKIEEVEKKEKELKEEGVEDLSLEEELEYWRDK